MDPRGIYDSQVQNETSSDKFVLHARLPSLQQMAYNQIAIAVWYRYCSTPRQRDYGQIQLPDSIDRVELVNCHKLVRTLEMPTFMKEIMRKYLKRVREETISCTRLFQYELFSENLQAYRIPQVDWEYFVWSPDGRINYKTTAIKMLHSGVLTEVQKFAIVSNFCLENEITICDLNHPLMETFIPKVNRARDPLLFYWICYLKNELHRIGPSFLRSADHHGRLHLIYKNKNHCEAFDYFWNHLSAEDQVSFISGRLGRFERYRLHYSLFCKMSHDQLSNLLFHRPVGVILFFLNKIEMPEWAIMAWKRCKHRISNEQFVNLLESVFDRWDNNPIPILRQEYKMSVLLEIWNTASDHQKNYAARQAQLKETLVHPILYYRKRLAPSSLKFLLKFLSFTSAQFRKNLILEGDPSFIFYFDFNAVLKIFELCLPNSRGKVELKIERIKYIIHPYFCKILYTVEEYDELNRRLIRSIQNLNISSKDTLENFIESLAIVNKRGYNQTYYTSDLARLSKFVAKILHVNVSTVLKMKESYFSRSFSANSDLCERYGSLNELSKLIEQEFVHEHLQELKNRLAEKLQAASVYQWGWYLSGYEMFTHLFSWCFENEEEMRLQVKRFIPINDIICEFLEKIGFRIAYFNSLDRFVEWYCFGVEEEIVSFKLGLINDPEITKSIEIVQKYDTRFRIKFLQWVGHPIELHAKTKSSTYGSTCTYCFFSLLFAVLSVILVHLVS
ncbi:uncharacterized protein LOC135844006 [Planococcus citri]|uniref:uncharacterized protein LOC135844006 n=1 Tax=Planococcus citri TaxID=170843 RepID=UPI0031FA2320